MAQLVTAYPKLFSKSPDQELSESVVKVSGNSKFTRLDVREQWGGGIIWYQHMYSSTILLVLLF